jgi:hypothetical protein
MVLLDVIVVNQENFLKDLVMEFALFVFLGFGNRMLGALVVCLVR